MGVEKDSTKVTCKQQQEKKLCMIGWSCDMGKGPRMHPYLVGPSMLVASISSETSVEFKGVWSAGSSSGLSEDAERCSALVGRHHVRAEGS